MRMRKGSKEILSEMVKTGRTIEYVPGGIGVRWKDTKKRISHDDFVRLVTSGCIQLKLNAAEPYYEISAWGKIIYREQMGEFI